MLRITGLRLTLQEGQDALYRQITQRLKIQPDDILTLTLHKKSLDARKKNNLHFMVTADITTHLDERRLAARFAGQGVSLVMPYVYNLPASASLPERPVVVGAGPAGLFAALVLAEAGTCPLLLERGWEVDRRTRDVDCFWQGGGLDAKSNVQFGEGGAGAFSDGKLNTGTKDPRSRKVLEEFVRCGAPEEILYQAKPHIGTDRLKPAIKALRQRILSLGGTVRFGTRMDKLAAENGQLIGIFVSAHQSKGDSHPSVSEFIPARQVVLAIGHSARDTLANLVRDGIPMEQKPFSLGVRIEHLQANIDRAQYGNFAGHPALGAADYRLAVHLPNGRGVYTFCMCPGGVVVGAASETGMVVTNGMSGHARSGRNANSALLCGVGVEDFPDQSVLSGVRWQQSLERAAFALGGGDYRAPVQLVSDFLQNVPSRELGSVEPTYQPGYTLGALPEILPGFVTESLRLGLQALDQKLPGFAAADAVLTGVETRSSSPVRILRGDDRESTGLRGLYPCGEGAGYAGGILSAAVDGIRTAEVILNTAGEK